MAQGTIGVKAGTGGGGGGIEALGLSVDSDGYVCQTIEENEGEENNG